MATQVLRDDGRERFIQTDTPDRRGAPFRISWGAIFAGGIAALAVWILLYALGLALGLSTLDPSDAGMVRASSIFTGLWGLVAPLVALFVGGMVAGRAVGPVTRAGGSLHGMVVWGLTTLAGVWLVGNLLGGALNSAVAVGRSVATGALTGAPVTEPSSAPRADHPVQSADDVVERVQDKLEDVGHAAAGAVKKQTLNAAPQTGAALWVVFGALALGLLAGLAGGAAGVTRGQRQWVEAGAGATDAVAVPIVAPAATAPVVELPDDSMAELRSEIAELRQELREMAVRDAEYRHH